MIQDLLLIGVGSGGCKILSEVKENVQKLFIDTDNCVIEKYSGLKIGNYKYSALGDTNLGELAVRVNKLEILNIVKYFKNIIILAPLGGGTSSGSTKKLVELLIDNHINVQLITNMPFDVEGKRRMNRAVQFEGYIQKLCPVKVLAKIDYSKFRNLIYNDLFNMQNEIYLNEIKKLLKNF